ncbi:MAG TPA: integrase arm-type DNA-binding domain-containing protein [Burkholderiaceae bacterium]|nr:integrase arm-type DNA-binding domain-containing protein [Burkholderiaceae bacterium]
MPLTDTAVKNAKPTLKPHRLADAGGLYVEVSPSGGKLWRWKYRFGGKEKRLALGVYPAVSLKEARLRRDRAREELGGGVDPGHLRKVEKLRRSIPTDDAFEAVAREWHQVQASGWAASHAHTVIRRLERDVFPWIGPRRIGELESPEVRAVLMKIEARKFFETAQRVREIMGQVFRYAIATQRATRNPAEDLKGALKTPVMKHHAAIVEPTAFGALVVAMRNYSGGPIVRAALEFSALVFQRPGEVRAATWGEFDLDKAMWTIPAARMKRGKQEKATGEPHPVPLSTQAVELLRDLYHLTGHRGAAGFVFPGERHPTRCISENSVRAALRTMGYGNDAHTPHGFRASARTMLDEQLHVPVAVIEAQLAHSVRDAHGRAYNRTTFLAERVGMMQKWADHLDFLAAQASASTAVRPG